MVSAAGVPRQPDVPVHTLSGTRRRFARIFAVVADLCADISKHAVTEFPELLTDQSLIRSLSNLSAVLPDQPELLSYQPLLFSHQSLLLTNQSKLLPDKSQLLSHKSILLANESELLADVA